MAVLTTTGKQWIVDKMRGSVSTKQEYIAWGTGSTAENASQTALITPAAEARTQGTITSPSAALHRVVGTITSLSSQTIAEVGLFDASSSGVMMIRAIHTGVPVVATDQIQYTIDLTVS